MRESYGEARIEVLTKGLSEAREQQAATGAILRVIAASPTDIQSVLNAVAESAARLCDAYDSTIYLRRGDRLAVGAHHGPIRISAAGLPVVRDIVTGRAVLDRVPVHVHDLLAAGDEFATGRTMAQQLGFRTILSIPLLREDEAIGALMIRRTEMRPFADKQIELLKTFADQAVIAIENVRLFTELGEALKQQTATADVLKVISRSTFDLQSVLDTLAESAARLCGANIADFYRLVEDGFQWAASFGDETEAEREHTIITRQPGRGSASGRVLLEHKTVHIPDFEADAEFTFVDVARKRGVRGMLGVPLLRGDALIGMLLLLRRVPGPFSPKQIELAETFADQAGIAIENVRLFEEIQARNREVTAAFEQQTATSEVLRVIAASPTDIQPVLQVVVESAARFCDTHDAVIFLEQRGMLELKAHFGPIPLDLPPLPIGRDWVSGRCFVDRQTVFVDDLMTSSDEYPLGKQLARQSGIRTLVATPLLRDEQPIGVLVIRRTEVRQFSEKQIKLLKTFADQAAIAIQNVRLFSEVQAKTRDLEESLTFQKATSDVLEVIGRSASTLQPVLDVIVETAAELCAADMSVVRLLRDGVLHHVASGSRNDPAVRTLTRDHPILPIDRSSAAGRVVLEGHTIQIPDLSADAEYTYLGSLGGSVVGSALGVPLLHSGRVVGTITLLRRAAGPFSPRQIALVETFADQAVIAIENVRLFEEVEARTAELGEALQQQTATADVLKVISRSAFDLPTVLDTLVESAVHVCEAEKGAIFQRRGDLYHFAASFGFSPEYEQYALENPLTVGRGSVTGRVAREGKTIHITDVLADPEYHTLRYQQLGGHRTTIGVPLLSAGLPVGVFVLTRTAVKPFTDKQIELVETFADQAVIAIENARLFTELGDALQQQTTTADVLKVISRSTFDLPTVLDTLVESAVHVCEAEKGAIFQRRGELYHMAASHGFSDDYENYARARPVTVDTGTALGRAVLTVKTVHVADVLADPDYKALGHQQLGGYRTILGVPLLSKGEPFGVFVLTRPQVKPFTAKQIELVETFADQAVIAIENVRLFDEVQARNREVSEALEQQTATGAILRVIAASPTDIQPVLQVVAESAARFCDTHDAVIFLADEGDLVVKAHYGPVPLDFASLPIGEGTLAGRAYAERKTRYVDDLLTGGDEFPHAKAMALKYGHRSIAATPLMRDEEAIGVIVCRRFEMRSFSEKQIELLRTFADQAVIAIQNVRLFDEVRAKTRELEGSLEDLRTAQDRLIQTEKLASLGQLTAGIAHEIKNPLNFVNNFASLSSDLLEELGETLDHVHLDDAVHAEVGELMSTLKGNFAKVKQHGQRADSIVKNMLLHSREGSSEHRPIRINSIVEESLNLAYHGARAEKKDFSITLQHDLDPTAGEVDLYPQEITRVLLNLISNGFYATAKRRMQSDGAYEPVLTASTKDLGDHVEIRIRDNGTGISPEVQEKMFMPFFTTKPAGEGTGLGLSISHDIVVKQHAGTIDIDTRPGEFTEFRIVLPRAGASLGSPHQPARSQGPR